MSLYLASRHFSGWYALNVQAPPAHVLALHLGHTDGGRLVAELYGHPDAALARERGGIRHRAGDATRRIDRPLPAA